MDEVSWHDWTPVTPGEKEQSHSLNLDISPSSTRSWKFLLPGEQVIHELQAVLLVNIDSAGILVATNHRLVFVLDEQICPLGTIPLGTIDRISKPQKVRGAKSRGPQHRLLYIYAKDVRIIGFGFQQHVKARRRVIQTIQKHGKPKDVLDLYAFAPEWAKGCPMESDPKSRLVKEYKRIIYRHQDYWTLSDINSNYSVCPTYPSVLVMPKSLSNEEIQQGADFRARGRLPTLCWQHPVIGAVLIRSSQPMSGIIMNSRRSNADEKLVAALCGPNQSRSRRRKLYIVDARPRKNALANGAMGGGSESSANYSQSEVVFLAIDNIHTMRESLSRLRDNLDVYGAASSSGSSSLLKGGDSLWGVGSLTSATEAVSAFGGIDWLTHNHGLLAGASWIATRIVQGSSVLVHCSDGWDRTSQLVTLVQIMLDPYYRTFDGLQALIEKDWLAFGHPFADRLGVSHSDPFTASNESSPIFLQWVDCLSHMLRLYPRAFEYSTAYLVDLVEAVLSCRFGSFVYNCEKEREKYTASACIWTYLKQIRHGRFNKYCNMFFRPMSSALLPPSGTTAPSIWPEYYLRWSFHPEPRRIGRAVDEDIQTEIRDLFRRTSSSDREHVRAEAKVEKLNAVIEDLNAKLRLSEKARCLAVADADRARRQTDSIKHAVETMGCDISFDESDAEDSGSTQMAISVVVHPKVDISAAQIRNANGSGKSSCRWPQTECQRAESTLDGLYVDYEALQRVSMDERYFHSSGVT